MRGHRVIVGLEDQTNRRLVCEMLVRAGCLVVGEASEGALLLRLAHSTQADLVVVDEVLPGISGIEVARIITEDRLAPVVMLGTYAQQLTITATEYWIFAYLVKPVLESALVSAVDLAMANFHRVIKLEGEVAELSDTLATRKAIDRAKGILMQHHGLTEQEAFRRIQKQAMNKRTTMRAVAEAIIMAAEISC